MNYVRGVIGTVSRKSISTAVLVGALTHGALSNGVGAAHAQTTVTTPCMSNGIPCQSARSVGNNSVPVPYAVFNSMFPGYTSPTSQRPDSPFGRGMVQIGGFLEQKGLNFLLVESDGVETLFLPNGAGKYQSEFAATGDLRELVLVNPVYQLISPDNSRVTYAKFGGLLFPVSEQDNLGHYMFKAEYSPSGALTKYTAQDGSVTTFEINPTSNKITKVTPSFGPATTYEYLNGYLSKVSQNGSVIELAYANGNVSSVKTTAPAAPQHVVTFTYGPHNVLTGSSDSRGINVTYTYAGSVVTQASSAAATGNVLGATKTTYQTFPDKAPRYSVPTKVESIKGPPSNPGMVVFLATVDNFGRPLKTTDATGLSTAYEYANGSPYPTKVTNPDGTSVVMTRNAAQKYRVDSYEERGSGANAPVISTAFQWDATGTPSRTDTFVSGPTGRTFVGASVVANNSLSAFAAATTNTTYFTYDDTKVKGRVSQVMDEDGVTRFTYDGQGRIATQATNGVSTTITRNLGADGAESTTISSAGTSLNFWSAYDGSTAKTTFQAPGFTDQSLTTYQDKLDETRGLPWQKVDTNRSVTSSINPAVAFKSSDSVTTQSLGGGDVEASGVSQR